MKIKIYQYSVRKVCCTQLDNLRVFGNYHDTIIIVISKLLSIMIVIVVLSLSTT